MNTIVEVFENLKKAEKIALFAHENPDGDAIGSLSAAKAILSHMGKQAFICFAKEPPKKFSYLLSDFLIMPKELDFDTALALDCGAKSRLGELASLYETAKTKLSIDHHFSNTPFADVYFTDHLAAANCELIYDMAIYLCGCVPKEAMAGIYTGISTDTGHFKFSNVTKKTMEIAAELIGQGLDHRSITTIVYDTVRKEKLAFLGEAYKNIKVLKDGRISFLYCSDELLKKYDIEFSDVEELPNTILSLEGVKVAVLLKDKDGGGFKVSMRGKNVADLSEIASFYGGGGHVNAAGLSIDAEDYESTLADIIEKIDAALAERN